MYWPGLHERTRFGVLEKRGQLTQLPPDGQAILFRQTHDHLNASNMQGYEVSNFAVSPQHRSRHNQKYWSHVPYLGLGPSAHSFHDNKRWWNQRNTTPWQQHLEKGQQPVAGSEQLEIGSLVLESLMLGLRTYAGVDLDRLRSRWGVDLLAANPELVPRLVEEGLATLEGNRLVPRLDGLIVADSLAPLFEVP